MLVLMLSDATDATVCDAMLVMLLMQVVDDDGDECTDDVKWLSR